MNVFNRNLKFFGIKKNPGNMNSFSGQNQNYKMEISRDINLAQVKFSF